METAVNASPHLRNHLPEELLELARRESRTEPPNAGMLPLRSLLAEDASARDSAANIMSIAGCALRDIERMRLLGVGVGVLERFVIQHNRLPLDVLDLANFIKTASGSQA